MAITKEKKRELVDQYTEMLQQSQGIVITHYRGMDMNQLTELRRQLEDSNGVFMITKNTLLRLALDNAGLVVPEELISGPVAIGFAMEDVAGTAKVLLDADEDDALKLQVTGGIIGDSVFDPEQLEEITKLPTLPELRAQLAGLLTAPASSIASIVEQPARDVVGVIDAASGQLINVLAAYLAENQAEEAA